MRFLYTFFVVFSVLFFSLSANKASAWGFFGHKLINRTAVFLMPPEMIGFYKTHIQFLTENSVNPDRRRYAVEGEAPRHYIDIDHYGADAIYTMPRKWKDAVAKYTEDTLKAYGIVPWHIEVMTDRLTRAFRNKDVKQILLYSADLGHYIGDGNVPLHTTSNYNGQMSGQYGIHGFWESRLPELYSNEYDFFFEKGAEYEPDVLGRAWNAVTVAHLALDSVFRFERELTERMGDDQKFTFETRGRITVKAYSEPFSRAYHTMLGGQVERQMRSTIKMVADLWFTAWVNAGKPDLDALIEKRLSEEERKAIEEEMEDWQKNRKFKSREDDQFEGNLPDKYKNYGYLPNFQWEGIAGINLKNRMKSLKRELCKYPIAPPVVLCAQMQPLKSPVVPAKADTQYDTIILGIYRRVNILSEVARTCELRA
ncbi:MAG: S1/P1 Nuclease [Bernardetiaceae bacterium]|nr:S1/P1 Nuclease [Bernardetiaceae bacterium]